MCNHIYYTCMYECESHQYYWFLLSGYIVPKFCFQYAMAMEIECILAMDSGVEPLIITVIIITTIPFLQYRQWGCDPPFPAIGRIG